MVPGGPGLETGCGFFSAQEDGPISGEGGPAPGWLGGDTPPQSLKRSLRGSQRVGLLVVPWASETLVHSSRFFLRFFCSTFFSGV